MRKAKWSLLFVDKSHSFFFAENNPSRSYIQDAETYVCRDEIVASAGNIAHMS